MVQVSGHLKLAATPASQVSDRFIRSSMPVIPSYLILHIVPNAPVEFEAADHRTKMQYSDFLSGLLVLLNLVDPVVAPVDMGQSVTGLDDVVRELHNAVGVRIVRQSSLDFIAVLIEGFVDRRFAQYRDCGFNGVSGLTRRA